MRQGIDDNIDTHLERPLALFFAVRIALMSFPGATQVIHRVEESQSILDEYPLMPGARLFIPPQIVSERSRVSVL